LGGPETLEEQLLGKEPTTQFGRLLQELAIESIAARSPQAKGRVKGCLDLPGPPVSELRLAGAKTLEEANRVLKAFLLAVLTGNFAVSPPKKGGVSSVPTDLILNEVFCFKYTGPVGADNVVTLGAHRVQIYPCNGRQKLPSGAVEIQERMDGSLAVYYQGKCLATKPAPAETPVLGFKGEAVRFAGISPEALFSFTPEKKPILKKKRVRRNLVRITLGRRDFKKKFTQKKYSPTDIFSEQLT